MQKKDWKEWRIALNEWKRALAFLCVIVALLYDSGDRKVTSLVPAVTPMRRCVTTSDLLGAESPTLNWHRLVLQLRSPGCAYVNSSEGSWLLNGGWVVLERTRSIHIFKIRKGRCVTVAVVALLTQQEWELSLCIQVCMLTSHYRLIWLFGNCIAGDYK